MKARNKRSKVIIFLVIITTLACSIIQTTQVVTPSLTDSIEEPELTETTIPGYEIKPEESIDTPLPPQSPTPTVEIEPEIPSKGSHQAWMGGFGCGVTLLDENGNWWGFREKVSPLTTDQVYDIALDTSGKAWIVDSLGIRYTDGHLWGDVSTDFSLGGEAIAVNEVSGFVWVAAFKHASVFDGNKWTTYPSTYFGESDFVDQVKDIAIDGLARVWLATGSSITMFDGKSWQYWEEGSGFDKHYFIETLSVGMDGRVWVGHSDGILVYDGQRWTQFSTNRLRQVQDIAVDPNGRVWATTWANGIFVYDGQSWVNYTRENSGVISNRTRAIAFDHQGRTWIGTTWGLSVFDGLEWTSYTMSTSGLAGPCIDAIAVGGNGPPLPQPTEPKLGGVTGKIMLGTKPVADATIVLCSDEPGMFYSGDHPCSDYPYYYIATTDNQGVYTFTDIPVGEYYTTWRVPDGKWMAYLIGGEKIVIKEGTLNEAPTIDATEQ